MNQLDEHLVVIDSTGMIRYVNYAWIAFGQANGIRKDFEWVGSNYFTSCKADHDLDGDIAQNATDGIRSVIDHASDHFRLTYPCHSPFEERWFRMVVTPLGKKSDNLILIRHINTTVSTVATKLSEEDPLTGLHNRRFLKGFLDKEWRRCLRHKGSLSLVFLDLDNFKQMNDNLGHLAGDRSLIRFAHLLSNHARRPSDAVARLGGDEFALILGDSVFSEALETATAIRTELESLAIEISDDLTLTTSIGFVNGVLTDNQEIEKWWERADLLLYREKSQGGNQVIGAYSDSSTNSNC